MKRQQPQESEADRLRFGRVLFDDAKGRISRGEEIDDTLRDALAQWSNEALVLAHQDDPERAQTWYSAWSSMDGALQAAVAHQPVSEITFPDAGGMVRFPEDTTDSQPFELPEAPSSMEGRPFALDKATARRASILTEPIQYTPEGAKLVDAQGETWDLTEALAELNQPEVREQLRQSMMETVPGEPAVSHTLGAMPSYQMLLRGAGKLDTAITGAPPIANLRTASPLITLPWALPGIRDLDEKLKDPVYTRALIETIGTLDAEPTGTETLGHALAGLADFVAWSKAVGLVGEGVAEFAGGVAPNVPIIRLAERAAVSNAGKAVLPGLNSSLARTAASFGAYEATTKAFDERTTIAEDVWHGVQQGAVFSAAGSLAKLGRGLVTATKLGEKLIPQAARTLLSRLTPRPIEQALAAVPHTSDELMETLSRFSEPTFSKTFEKAALAPHLREALKSSLDSYWIGVLVHSYGQAQAAPEGQGFSTFWRSIFSTNSQATGLAFALNGALQYGGIVRPAIKDALASPEGQAYQERMARAFGSPNAERPLRETWEQFRRWQKAEPELFNRIDFMSPAKQEAKARSAAMEQARPPDALPAFDEMRADGGERRQLTVGEFNPDRLEMLGFRAKTAEGRFKHALNATNEYLRVVERAEGDPYHRFSDVPEGLFRRVLDWRDRGKPTRQEVMDAQLRQMVEELRIEEGVKQEQAGLEPKAQGGGQAALEEIPGNEYRGETRPPPALPGTLEDAARTLEKVGAEPSYQGLAPLERVAKAKTTPKRPSLNEGISRVLAGKATAEQLRAWFPEGAEGPTEGAHWTEKFAGAVKEAWKQRRVQNLGPKFERKPEANTLRNFVRRTGGIKYVGDLKNLYEEYKGLKPVVHGPKSRKGLFLDDMAEAATEEGFFPGGRPTEAEMIDALMEDRFHPESTGEHLMQQHEADVARMHADQLEKAREEFLDPANELPDDPDQRRQLLTDVFAGDTRFAGATPERIERQVLDLRAQAAGGDPGPVLAGPPETPADAAVRASIATREFVGTLQMHGLLDVDVTPDSPEAMGAVMELVRGVPPPEGFDATTWSKLREDAVSVREQTRFALREALRGTWDEATLARYEDVWAFVDAQVEGRDVPADVRQRLSDLTDEEGAIQSSAIDRLQQQAAEAVWAMTREREQAGDTGFASFAPALGFFGRKFTSVEDNKWGRLWTWQFWMDQPEVQEFLGRNKWANNIFKAVTAAMGTPLAPILNLGPLSRPQSTRTQRIMETSLHRLAIARGKAEAPRMAVQFAMDRLAKAWGGMRPPQADLDFFTRGMEADGRFAGARGPEDFEAMRPGTAYMYPIYTRLRDAFEEVGRELVSLGKLTHEQFTKLGGGKYLAHYFVRQQLEDDAADLSQGRVPVKWQGRSMLRENGVPLPDEPSLRISDPAYVATRAIVEETQMVRIFTTLRDIAEGPGAITEAELRQLPAWDRTDHIRAARRIVPIGEENLFQAVRREARGSGDDWRTLELGARLQTLLDQMAKPGAEPTPGKAPYTAEAAAPLLRLLGETKEGAVYLPKPLADELQITLSEMFTLPGESKLSKFGAVVDQMLQFRKRGLTMFRPANWTLQILGNAERNAVLGGVPRYDFLKGLMGLPSFTLDGINGMAHYMRWIAEEAPSKRPESWSESDWIELMKARNFVRSAGPASSTFVQMGPDFAQGLGGSLTNPHVTQRAWMAQLDARAAREGWSLDVRDRMALHIEQLTGRMFKGLEGFDAKVLGWVGEGNPIGKARAFGAVSATWNLVDLFMFKYPAFLKASHEWPDVARSKVLTYALQKTTHAGDTSPVLRRGLSMRTPWNDRLWKAAQKSNARAYTKLAVAQLFRHRFWMDASTSVPQILRAVVTRPDRVAASAAIGVGVSALLAATMNDDEKRKWKEEAASARNSVTRFPALSEKDEEALRAFGHRVGSMVGGDIRLPERLQGAAGAWWRQLLLPDPMSVPMPKHGGESRLGSLAELTPPGQVLNLGRGLANMATGALGAGESREKAENFASGFSRVFGMEAQAAAGLALGAVSSDSELVEALGGRGTVGEALGKALFSVAGSGGVMYPTLGLFTPEGQFMGEAAALGGQRWNEWARGIQRAYNPQDAGAALGSVALRYLWPSRSMYQRPPLKSPVDGWTAVLAEMYGPGFDPSSADGRAKLRAHSFVSQQMSTLIADLYEQHFDEQGEPGKASFTLDERVRGALMETFGYTEPGPAGWQIKPGYQPKSVLLQAIAARPASEQPEVIEHLRAWAARERFQEDGMTTLFEAGRRLEMPKALFREAFRNALVDPGGGNLVKWWWSQAENGDDETLGQLAPLVHDVEVPAEGSEAHEDYLKLMRRYLKAGLSWPPSAAKRSDEALAEKGAARALQGGKALRKVLSQRPLLERLLQPQENR